jgi:hypothetical protein
VRTITVADILTAALVSFEVLSSVVHRNELIFDSVNEQRGHLLLCTVVYWSQLVHVHACLLLHHPRDLRPQHIDELGRDPHFPYRVLGNFFEVSECAV